MPYITLQSDWQSLADKAFKAVNGDKGGTYAPTSPIQIGASGMNVTGPTEVNHGGVIKSTNSSRFNLGNDEWPKLAPNHVGRTRDIRSPMHKRLASLGYWFADCPTFTGSLQTIACSVLGTSVIEQPKCHVPLRVHDGSRFITGVLKFRVPTPRSKAPLAMPKARLIRVDMDGKIESLRAESSTVDADGYSFFPVVTSGDAWYNGGAAQSWSFTCDQNNIIDTSTYVYYLQLQEETGLTDATQTTTDGTIVRVRKRDVVYTFQYALSLTGNPNPVVNGPTLVTGNEVLVVANSGGAANSTNGLWVVDTGGIWTRRNDLSVASDFVPNFLVYDSNLGVLWESISPTYGQSISLAPANAGGPTFTPLLYQKRVPRGNIYHSITCTFDQITDMRPQ